MKHIKLYEEFTTESIDTKYWADYNDHPGPKWQSEKSKNFDDTFDAAIENWNLDADGPENKLNDKQIAKVQKLAKEFFKKEGWITFNIVLAMITQES